MNFSFQQLWQAYEDKKEVRRRAIVARAELEQWIDCAIVFRRRLKTVSDDEYYRMLAEKFMDYAHATYNPVELAKFLKNLVEVEQQIREYDAQHEAKAKAEV